MHSNQFETKRRRRGESRRRASFSLDVLTAVILVSCVLALGLYALKASVFVFSAQASNALREQKTMVFADYLLKNCFDEGGARGPGLIKCSETLAFSHELDEKALIELSQSPRQEKVFPAFDNAFVAVSRGGQEVYSIGAKGAERTGFCVSRIALLEDEQVVVRACT